MAGKMLMRKLGLKVHLIEPELPPDFLDLCEHKVRSIEADLANNGKLFNQRQCQDLSTKLSKTKQNIEELVSQSGASTDLFRPALENLYRYLEKAILLVKKCGEEDWCAAVAFQCQNESAFREILLDIGLCYNAIYEQAKSTSGEWNVHLEDLRESAVFLPASGSDVLEDRQDLQQGLEDLVNNPSSVEPLGHSPLEEVALKQCLARYVLVKMHSASEQSQATIDTCSEILWQKESEPPGTWGNSHYLGAGATDGGVCRTEWLGIPCAKKEFHVKEYESLFLKEAGILAHLKHPCIINFICCSNGEARGDPFIAMELMEKSLLHLIQDQKNVHFSLPVVVGIIVQVARGMWHLHDQGVAHRDLKPQNVVVNRLTFPQLEDHFGVKLVDFGILKTKVGVSKSNIMTAHGIDTTMYRAPKVHLSDNSFRKGRTMWMKADVFSFVMTCSHVLSLKISFQDMEVAFISDELYNGLMNGWRSNLQCDCLEEIVSYF